MPIYEYICDGCRTCFEEIMPAGSEKTPPCPKCKTAQKVRKQMSACSAKSGSDKSSGSCAPRSGFS
jgi:putative FmdB family regulatory protein